MIKRKKTPFHILFLYILICSSCKATDSIICHDSEQTIHTTHTIEEHTITLTFAGDIMAHTPNFTMHDYNKIYTDLADILHTDDLSFGNMEMPICDSLPMSNYPRFNVHSPYLQAASNGGFDVFAFANNHTNDQGVHGINGTMQSITKMQEHYKTHKNIYFSGIKKTDAEEMQPTIIKKNSFTIMFLSITEILNNYDNSKNRVYYSAPTKKGRSELLKKITNMRKNQACDIFILALHSNEPEYNLNVCQEKKTWFKKLAQAGVDIIYASHPHVMQPWEKYTTQTDDDQLHTHFFMYSMGNFISSQRMHLNYNNPYHYREYTGDAVLLQLTYTKRDNIVLNDFHVSANLITVYKSKDGFIMKHLDTNFIESLHTEQDKHYYKTRLHIMKEYLPLE